MKESKEEIMPVRAFGTCWAEFGRGHSLLAVQIHDHLQPKAKMSSGVWKHRFDEPPCHSSFQWLLQSTSEADIPQVFPVLHPATLEQNNTPSQIDNRRVVGVSSSEAPGPIWNCNDILHIVEETPFDFFFFISAEPGDKRSRSGIHLIATTVTV